VPVADAVGAVDVADAADVAVAEQHDVPVLQSVSVGIVVVDFPELSSPHCLSDAQRGVHFASAAARKRHWRDSQH